MTTEERLEKLERGLTAEKRRNRWILGCLACLVLGGITIAATPGEKIIRANQFVLEDAKGNILAEMKTVVSPGRLTPDEFKAGIQETAQKDVSLPSFVMYGPQGGKTFEIESTRQGRKGHLFGVNVQLFEGRVRFSGKNDEDKNIDYIEMGKTLLGMRVGYGLFIRDSNQYLRLIMGVTREGPSLAMRDADGNTRSVFGVAATQTPDGTSIQHPESTLTLFGPDSKVLRRLP